ncbi:TPA: hypothetical protein ACX3KG_005656, partial [Raoultella ornithinolytica]
GGNRGEMRGTRPAGEQSGRQARHPVTDRGISKRRWQQEAQRLEAAAGQRRGEAGSLRPIAV